MKVRTLRAYFDTNVYSHLQESSPLGEARDLLREAGWELLASSQNLFEMFSIPDADLREREVHALSRLATRFDDRPKPYRDAAEVYSAIRKHRPGWIRKVASTSRTRSLLREHVGRWRDVKAGRVPDTRAYARYRVHLERNIREARNLRSQLRAALLKREGASIRRRYGNRTAVATADLTDPRIFWRFGAWLSFEGALLQRYSQTRDLAHYLQPLLKVGIIDPEDFFMFWMKDVEPADVPRAMWAGLVAFGQLGAKGSHGDPADQAHAAHALAVDVFVTADRRFYEALRRARTHYPFSTATIVHWERRGRSAIDALRACLRDSVPPAAPREIIGSGLITA